MALGVEYRERLAPPDKELVRRLLGAFTSAASRQDVSTLAGNRDFPFYLSFTSRGSKNRHLEPITLFGETTVVGVELLDDVDQTEPPIFFVAASTYLNGNGHRFDIQPDDLVLVIDANRLHTLEPLLNEEPTLYINSTLDELLTFDDQLNCGIADEQIGEASYSAAGTTETELGLSAQALSYAESLVLMESEETAAQIVAAIFDAFDVTRSNLVKHGLEHVQPKIVKLESGMLVTFAEYQTSKLVQIPVRQVMSLDEAVEPQDQTVAGIFVPNELMAPENLEEVYDCLPQASIIDLANELDDPAQTQIAIATTEQIEIWNRLGFFGELTSQRQAEVQMSDILDFLEQSGISIIADVDCATHHFGEDFLFRNPDNKNNVLNPLKKINFVTKGEKGKSEVVDNTVAIVLVEDGLTVTEKKDIAKRIRNQLRPLFPGIDATKNKINVLAVDSEVFEHWKMHVECNQPFWEDADSSLDSEEPDEMETIASPEERKKGRVRKVSLKYFEIGAPGIGAKPAYLEVCYENGDRELLLLDFGSQYENFAWGSDFTKPSKEKGIIPFLEHLPEVPGMIRLDLIKTSAKNIGYEFFTDEQYGFWMIELLSRMEEEDFVNFINSIDVDIFDYLEPHFITLHQRKKEHKKTKIIGAFFSHPHDDHIGWAGLLESTFPRIFSRESLPWYLYYYQASGSNYLKKESLLRRDENSQIICPPVLMPEPYQEITLGAGRVRVTLGPMDHSLADSMIVAEVVENDEDGVEKKLSTFGYTGDFRFEDSGISEETLKWLMTRTLKALLTDSTNIHGGDVIKGTTLVTKETVKESFLTEIAQTDGLVIIQMPVNNLRDAYFVYQAALESGRKIVLSPQMAGFFALQERFDVKSAGGDSKIKRRYPRIRPSQFYILHNDKKTFTSFQKASMLRHEQVVTTAELNRNHGEYVLLITPQPILEQQLNHINIKKIDKIIRAMYGIHSLPDKWELKKNQEFAGKWGVPYLRDYYIDKNNDVKTVENPRWRQSGHATIGQFEMFVKALIKNCRTTKWINIHGENRRETAELIEKWGEEVAPELEVNALKQMTKGGEEFVFFLDEEIPEHVPEYELEYEAAA